MQLDEGGAVTLADFTGLIEDPGGGRYERFISPDAPDHDPFADYPPEGQEQGLDPARHGALYAIPMAVTATLAHNLAVRRSKIWACWGTGVQVGWIGNLAHQKECSDHNKDAAGVVHAIDPMVTGARAQAVVDQFLAHNGDLQYVIHNGVIWSVTVGWAPRKYLGADQHTSHVHASGRHGGSNSNGSTCTGYNLTAQNATPTFELCPSEGDDMTRAEMETLADLIGTAVVKKFIAQDLGHPGGGDTVGTVFQTGVLGNSNKVLAKLDEIIASLTPPAV